MNARKLLWGRDRQFRSDCPFSRMHVPLSASDPFAGCEVFAVSLFVYMPLGNVERWHTACADTGMSANHSKRKSNSPNIFLAAARRGNPDAFVALVSPHASNLRRLAQSFTRNAEDAEDICQQSLLKAFTKLDHFAAAKEVATAEFRSWLAKITANSAIDFLRRRRSARLVR